MPKYIDAERLPIAKMWVIDEAGWGASFYGVYKEDLDKAPVVDVVPVVHGRWVGTHDGWYYSYSCSECGTEALTKEETMHDQVCSAYCPYCGARMDGNVNG